MESNGKAGHHDGPSPVTWPQTYPDPAHLLQMIRPPAQLRGTRSVTYSTLPSRLSRNEGRGADVSVPCTRGGLRRTFLRHLRP
jgi:hypothetical protein